MRRAARVDGNQAEIVAALRAVGAEWIPTSADPRSGCDGFVAYRGKLWPVEIKDPAQPESKRALTENERKTREKLERVGVRYNVVETREDALRLIGAMR